MNQNSAPSNWYAVEEMNQIKENHELSIGIWLWLPNFIYHEIFIRFFKHCRILSLNMNAVQIIKDSYLKL